MKKNQYAACLIKQQNNQLEIYFNPIRYVYLFYKKEELMKLLEISEITMHRWQSAQKIPISFQDREYHELILEDSAEKGFYIKREHLKHGYTINIDL